MLEKDLSIQLQPRDVELFAALLESRFLAHRHIVPLFYDGHAEAAKKRLRRLVQSGYLEWIKREFQNVPALFRLTRRSYDFLRDCNRLLPQRRSWEHAVKRTQVSSATIAHHLEVLDVLVAFHTSANESGEQSMSFTLDSPDIWFRTRSGTGHEISPSIIKPDAKVILKSASAESRQTWEFFLEVDRGTESLGILARKVRAYTQYYRSGDYAVSLGKPRDSLRRYPFRVLMILPSPQRRDNVARYLLQIHPPVRQQVWLTTRQECLVDPLATIWLTTKDYQRIEDDEELTRFKSEIDHSTKLTQYMRRLLPVERPS